MIDGKKAVAIARVLRHMLCLFCCKLSISTQSFEDDCVYCKKCGQKICRYHLTESFAFKKYQFADTQSYVCTWTCINCVCTKPQVKYNINTSIKFTDGRHYWKELAEKQRKERAQIIRIYQEENNLEPHLSSDQYQNPRKLNSRSSQNLQIGPFESNGKLLFIHLYHYNNNDKHMFVYIINTVSDQQPTIPDQLQLPNSNLNNNEPADTQSNNQQNENYYPYNQTSYLEDGFDYSQTNDTNAMERDDYNQYNNNNNYNDYYHPWDNDTNAMERDDYNQYEDQNNDNDNGLYDSDLDYSKL